MVSSGWSEQWISPVLTRPALWGPVCCPRGHYWETTGLYQDTGNTGDALHGKWSACKKLRVIKAQCYLILCSRWPVSWQFILHCQGHSNTGSMWIKKTKKTTQIISNFAKSKHKVLGQIRKTENDVIIDQTNIFPTVELKIAIKYQINSNEYWSYYSLKNLEKCVSQFPQKY